MSITNFCEPVVKSCHACEKKGNEMNFSGLAKKKKKNLQLMILSVNIDANLNIVTMAAN